MAKKYYAVKAGKTPGIYTDWESCKKEIDGFSKAVFKSFKTLEEANAWLEGKNIEPTEEKPKPEEGSAIAYVDGSFFAGGDKFSYGIVLFVKDEEIHLAKSFKNAELLKMRNVAGEIMGAAQAMKTACEMGCKKITIYHDYEGIAKWCKGSADGGWQANTSWTIKYKKFYDEISQKIQVEFVKVKAHSKNKYNDLADKLAKEALQ